MYIFLYLKCIPSLLGVHYLEPQICHIFRLNKEFWVCNPQGTWIWCLTTLFPWIPNDIWKHSRTREEDPGQEDRVEIWQVLNKNELIHHSKRFIPALHSSSDSSSLPLADHEIDRFTWTVWVIPRVRRRIPNYCVGSINRKVDRPPFPWWYLIGLWWTRIKDQALIPINATSWLNSNHR